MKQPKQTPQLPRRKVRSAYGPKNNRVVCKSGNDARTKQSFKNECDINNIMAKYQKTGAINHVQNNQAHYGFADSVTFTESMNIVAKAQSMFNELPSSIRSKFRQDPAAFLDFVQDEANADELVELGLANAPRQDPANTPPTATQPVTDPAPNPPPAE